MILAKNYEKLSKCVKITAKILSVPFFRTRCMRRGSYVRVTYFKKYVDGLQHKGIMSIKAVFEKKIAKKQKSCVPVCGRASFVLLTPTRSVTIIDKKSRYFVMIDTSL